VIFKGASPVLVNLNSPLSFFLGPTLAEVVSDALEFDFRFALFLYFLLYGGFGGDLSLLLTARKHEKKAADSNKNLVFSFHFPISTLDYGLIYG